jgi:hypothetical protein
MTAVDCVGRVMSPLVTRSERIFRHKFCPLDLNRQALGNVADPLTCYRLQIERIMGSYNAVCDLLKAFLVRQPAKSSKLTCLWPFYTSSTFKILINNLLTALLKVLSNEKRDGSEEASIDRS